MLVVGLTGGLASGKSTVAGWLKQKGALLISADDIAHKLMQPSGKCYKKVIHLLGKEITDDEGINRKAVARKVFNSAGLLKKLENILHPAVAREIKMRLKDIRKIKPASIVIIEVPLLFEAGFDTWMDITVAVISTQQQQISRSKAALGLSRIEALKRIKAQMPLKTKIRKADFIIDNRKTFKQTHKQVDALWQELSQKTKEKQTKRT